MTFTSPGADGWEEELDGNKTVPLTPQEKDKIRATVERLRTTYVRYLRAAIHEVLFQDKDTLSKISGKDYGAFVLEGKVRFNLCGLEHVRILMEKYDVSHEVIEGLIPIYTIEGTYVEWGKIGEHLDGLKNL